MGSNLSFKRFFEYDRQRKSDDLLLSFSNISLRLVVCKGVFVRRYRQSSKRCSVYLKLEILILYSTTFLPILRESVSL